MLSMGRDRGRNGSRSSIRGGIDRCGSNGRAFGRRRFSVHRRGRTITLIQAATSTTATAATAAAIAAIFFTVFTRRAIRARCALLSI